MTPPQPDLGILVVVWLVFLVIGAGLYVWYALMLSRVFGKLGAEPWKAWVPILNESEIFRLGGIPPWSVVFFFLPIVQFYGIYLKVVATSRINQHFGRGAGATALAILLPPVWATLLAGGGRAPDPALQERIATSVEPRSGYAFAVSTPQPPVPEALPPVPAAAGVPPVPPPPPPPPAPAGVPPLAPPPPPPPPSAPAAVAPPAVPAVEPVAPPVAPPVASPFSPPPAPPALPPLGAGLPTPPAATPPAATPVPPAATPPVAPPSPEPLTAPPALAPVDPPAVPAAAPVIAPPPMQIVPPPSIIVPPPGLPTPPVVAAPVVPPAEIPAQPWASLDRPVAPPPAPAAEPVADDDQDEIDRTVVVDRRPVVPWRLVVDDGAVFQLTGSRIVLGRKPAGTGGLAQEIAIPDPTRTLSKVHARLELADGRWTVTDLNATNGVIVIEADGTENLLDPGASAVLTERFVLGKVGMRLVFGEDDAPR